MSERGFKQSSLVQLTLVRFREFIRQPEAVFWTFVFPILLAVGLGLAFRSKAPGAVNIGTIVPPPPRVSSMPDVGPPWTSLNRDSGLKVTNYRDTIGGYKALRTGKIALLVEADSGGKLRYTYDPQREDAVCARFVVERVIQISAGRKDPVTIAERKVTEKGSRYIDFVIPGLLGMNLMGSGIW